MSGVLTSAMFPLGSVLFPHQPLPLRVFEPRYRQMLADCLADDGRAEFGVTLIERGREVGGGDVRASIGTMARIVDVRQLPNGHLGVLAIGGQRLEVVRWLPDEPYPRAEVELLDEPEPTEGLAEVHAQNVVLLRRCLAIGTELGEPGVPATVQLDDDPVVGGFQACAVAPLGPMDRYRLLMCGDSRTRADTLHELLAEQRAMLALRMGELRDNDPPDLPL